VTRTNPDVLVEHVGLAQLPALRRGEKIVVERDVAIASAGSHTERIFPTEPGDYVIKAEAQDDRGNLVTVASTIWVIGKGRRSGLATRATG